MLQSGTWNARTVAASRAAQESSLQVDVIVVGGGLSGLVAGYRLSRTGFRVQVLESEVRTGGVIGSERRNGVLFERGPNNALDNGAAIHDLVEELGIAGQRVDARPAASRRYIVHEGGLAALPTSAGSFMTTPLFSMGAKLRLFAEPFIARRTAATEESIADFVRRRLGPEVLAVAVEPFVAGIMAADPERISVAAAVPRLHALEQQHGSLLRGALATAGERRRVRGGRRAVSFSFRDGMQTLSDALTAAQAGVECGRRVVSITRGAGGAFAVELAGGERREARAVVIATPSDAAARMVEAMAPEAAAALHAIPYAPVAVVVMAYPRASVAHPLDGFGFLAPVSERRPLLGTLFCTTLFEGRADASTVVLTTFLGGSRDPEIVEAGDDKLRALVRSELSFLLGATGEPTDEMITRWRNGLPQYGFGHLQRIGALEQAERALPGLHFCASYRGGASIGDCIANATETARRVEAQL